MAISKVILNGTTLMDVTSDTVAANVLHSGYQATGPNGAKVQGAYNIPTGTKTITENGTGIDVEDYEKVDVNVPNIGTEIVRLI